jgi:2-C-methyl-D-erythritol 4-phosphate cytidylyltransferase
MHLLIAAAGSGRRMGASVNKLLLPVAGRPVLAWTLEAALASPAITWIGVMGQPEDEAAIQALLAAASPRCPLLWIVGGATRQESVRLGLAALPPEAEAVLIHDGARCLAPPELFSRCARALEEAMEEGEGIIAATPVTDTIKQVDPRGRITGTPDRQHLWAAQTPQGFAVEQLRGAHRQALEDGWSVTDDAALYERLGLPVRVLDAPASNIKLTTPFDLSVAEAVLRDRMAALPVPPPEPANPPAHPGPEVVEAIARLWLGRFDNRRQVQVSLARGGTPAPELTREHRSLEVVRLEAPQLGEVVLYLQECRATAPGLAHRQRVMRLVPDAGAGLVRAEQLFFREGPTYDRPLLPAERVCALEETAFVRHPGCDLFFRFEEAHNRWRGAMRPGTCRYPHPRDGEVCAEFAMLLSENQLWYRDRSLRLRDGGIRGEVDGFSWLLFDRLPTPPATEGGESPADLASLVALGLPALAQQMGLWEGTFRRYDAEGRLRDTFASTVVQRLEAREGSWHYSQTSLFPEAAEGPRRIEATGRMEGGRLWFQSERLDGWAMDVPEAPGTTVLLFESRDGSNLRVQEISQLLEGGRRRLRTTQTLQDGRLLSRSHIDEHKTLENPLGQGGHPSSWPQV